MHAETDTPGGAERRGAPRYAAKGPIRLTLQGPPPRVIDGQLVDQSVSGFRAQHSSRLLDSGTTVDFAGEARAGRARVVWTRIVGGRVESGFLILPEEECL
jgi:hypothetical protein